MDTMEEFENQISINIAVDFSETPGARSDSEGHFSGENFLSRILLPKFREAQESKSLLFIDLDNVEGYATSFLEEGFGGLVRIIGSPDLVLEILRFKSLDEPLLIEEIKSYIKEANQK